MKPKSGTRRYVIVTLSTTGLRHSVIVTESETVSLSTPVVAVERVRTLPATCVWKENITYQ